MRSRVPMRERVQMAWGLARSVWIYHGRDRSRHARMDALHAMFVRAGDRAFDVGSHVGDRVASLRRLGCHVVAIEPQPGPMRVLKLLFGRSPAVTLVQAAVGAREGSLRLHLNLANPTVATGSTDFIESAQGAPGWEGQRWRRTVVVPMTTLDALIKRYGEPAFVKIDVEGLEEQVLRGLSQALPAMSFEFTTIQREVALACLRRCERLGHYRYNAALGESQALAHPDWMDAAAMANWVRALPAEANSGDIYALRLDRAQADPTADSAVTPQSGAALPPL